MLTLEPARGFRSQSSTLEDLLQQGAPLVKNPTQVDNVPLRTASPPKILEEQVVRNHPVMSARRGFERRDASRIVEHGRRRQFVAFRRSILRTAFNFFLGRMSWGSRTTCSKAKVASKGTRSCPCCSPKGSILLSSRSSSGCRRESSFSHSSTTFTPSLHQTGQKNVPISCDRSSGTTAGFR